MSLPFFYTETTAEVNEELALSEETSRHVVQVLRMRIDEKLRLTDGKGSLMEAVISNDHKKKAAVRITEKMFVSRLPLRSTIAISLLKNSNRFEWFLEKATELGISEIIPLICERTEKQHFRADRFKGILVSAMLQSQQAWLPEFGEPINFRKLFDTNSTRQKFIAHCLDAEKKRDFQDSLAAEPSTRIILIGPEGDFTPDEIALAIKNNYQEVSLGETRLRTETAGMVAAVLIQK